LAERSQNAQSFQWPPTNCTDKKRTAAGYPARAGARHRGRDDACLTPFTPALYDEAKSKGWTVISMKNDWKRIFAFEQ
jgi:hypothetical protein